MAPSAFDNNPSPTLFRSLTLFRMGVELKLEGRLTRERNVEIGDCFKKLEPHLPSCCRG